MPPSFHYSEEHLEQLIATADSRFLNVVEFRHESWWTEEIFETLKKKNIVFSGVSFPKNIPDDFIINNSKSVYYRLHGVPVLFKSEYSEEELKKLAKEIKKAKQDVFVYFNNTWGTAALKNALYLKKILE